MLLQFAEIVLGANYYFRNKAKLTYNPDLVKYLLNNYSSKDEFFKVKVEDISCEINNNDISYVEFKIEGKEEKYYFYKN